MSVNGEPTFRDVTRSDGISEAEALARLFHDTYERLAPEYDYKTQEASAVPWEDVPTKNKRLMIAVAEEVLERLVIVEPPALRG